MKKLLFATLCVLMSVAFIAGCSSTPTPAPVATTAAVSSAPTTAPTVAPAPAQPVTITFAVIETDNLTPALWAGMISAFEKDNPGITVNKVLMTGDSRPAFLKALLAAGAFPDINTDPVELAKIKGVYAPVPEDLLAKFEDAAIVTFNGEKNLIPATKALRSQVYYNKDLFAKVGIASVPATWDDFLADCQKLKDGGVTPLITAGPADVWATAFGYWVGLCNPEIEAMDPTFNADVLSGKQKWDNPTILKSLQLWQDMINKGYYDKGSMSYTYVQASANFMKGNAAMMLDGAWVAATIDKQNLSNFGCFVLPTPGGEKTYCTMPGYWGVSATSKNLDAAFKFCAYCLGGNKDVYTSYLKADGLYSVTKTPVTYPLGSCQTQFLKGYDGFTTVPEITKVVGDNALPSGWEDFQLKSLQAIYTGADIKTELDKWDAEQATLLASH